MTARPGIPADRRPLREFVRDSVRERISNGTYPPGARLVERDLAADFNVSRLPVREALRMLNTEGYVEMLATRGVIVRRLTRTDVEELFDVREALETLAFRRAADRVNKGDIKRLGVLGRRAERAIAQGDHAILDGCNVAFHDLVVEIARNKVLADMLVPIESRLRWINVQNDDPETLWAEHRIMMRALLDGDAEASERLAYEHVTVNRDRVLIYLFGTPGATPGT